MSAFTPRVATLLAGLLRGDRASLARSITLVESSHPAHRVEAGALLGALSLERAKSASALRAPVDADDANAPRVRVGIAGPPGAGKSTLVEALGLHVLATHAHARVAVLAVDPSSTRSGGSLLGDAARMPELSRSARAFVRPSPTRGALGGLAPATGDALALAEGAGFGVVLVETVGVGQSEVAIAGAVDATVLVLAPAAGDELQGAKKGIVEFADIIVVNKADGALVDAARHAAANYARALSLSRPRHARWAPPVLTASASTGDGVARLWDTLLSFVRTCGAGELADTRRAQALDAAWRGAEETVTRALRTDAKARAAVDALAAALGLGNCAPRVAADAIAAAFLRK